MNDLTIRTGGQTGIDRAALDAALNKKKIFKLSVGI